MVTAAHCARHNKSIVIRHDVLCPGGLSGAFREQVFYLYLSLIGWFLLSLLTLGIGLLWFYPYAQACQHAFYQDVKHDYLMRRNAEKAASEYAPAAPASTTPAPEAPKASENPEDYMPK